MIVPSGAVRVLVATRPVDFRKGMDGLAALVRESLGSDPYSGVIYVFRAKRADRVKLLLWDGTGLVLVAKRLEKSSFRWPRISDGVMRLTSSQLSALLKGLTGHGCERCACPRRRRRFKRRDTVTQMRGVVRRARGDVFCSRWDDLVIRPHRSRCTACAAPGQADAPSRGALERLTAIIRELQRHRFGRRAERLDPEQLALALEDVEQTLAAGDAAAETDSTARKQVTPRRRQINRGALPPHLPREETIIDVADKTCACCGGLKHRIGEDVSERLDVIPAQFKVIVTRRPKYACRVRRRSGAGAGAGTAVGKGLPTEAFVAHVLIAKYADHTPLYRQAQIYARQGTTLDRSTLADWVGRAAFTLRPVRAPAAGTTEAIDQAVRRRDDGAGASIQGAGASRKGSSGLMRATSGLGPATLRQALPTSMRPTASMRGRPSISQGFSGILQVDGYDACGELARTR